MLTATLTATITGLFVLANTLLTMYLRSQRRQRNP